MDNNFNIISKMTDTQVESLCGLFNPHLQSTSAEAELLADGMQYDRPEQHNELITLDDGRCVYYDDEGYYLLKTNGHKHRVSALGIKQLIQKSTKEAQMTTTNTTSTEKMTFKDWYNTIAQRIDLEQIVSDFELAPDTEIYIQPEREYKGRFYPASFLFKFNNTIVAVSDILDRNGEYNIRTGMSDVALFMIVRILVNDGQVELPKRATRVISETGSKVYSVSVLGGKYDIIMNDGICTYAGKARPSEKELRNRRLAQLQSFKQRQNDARQEADIKYCSNTDRALAQDNHYDGKAICE